MIIFAGIYGAATGAPALHSGLDAIVYAAVIGIPVVLIESHSRHIPFIAATRQWPFGRMIMIKSAGYAAWIVVGMTLSALLTHWGGSSSAELLMHRDKLVAAIIVALVLNIFLAANRLLGPGVFVKFVSGRYYRPRRELRAFVFIDISGSTQIAERLGDFRFHAYVDDALTLFGDTAIDTGGEVHDYVGDGAMLTWAERRTDVELASPLAFFALLEERLHHAQAQFRSWFQQELTFRAAAHAGPVSVGEVGDVKQKIVYLGDTVNTAARLEQIARECDARILVTQPVLARWPLPPMLTATPIGPVPLRGKSVAIEAFRLDVIQPANALRSAGEHHGSSPKPDK